MVIVKILLDDPAVKNIVGLNGQANIITSEKDNVLSVPIDSLQNDLVLIKTAAGIKSQKVKTGFKSDTDAEITEGLKEGDRVITNPADFTKK